MADPAIQIVRRRRRFHRRAGAIGGLPTVAATGGPRARVSRGRRKPRLAAAHHPEPEVDEPADDQDLHEPDPAQAMAKATEEETADQPTHEQATEHAAPAGALRRRLHR